MDAQRDWTSYLPDRANWTQVLAGAADSGSFMSWKDDADRLMLMSTMQGDQVEVQDGGVVGARIAMDRHTCVVTYPFRSVPMEQWETQAMGVLVTVNAASSPTSRVRPARWPGLWLLCSAYS